MARYEFHMPDLGEGLTEAEIKAILVRVGESVAADAPLLEVETDKSLVEIPSPVAGRVTAIEVEVGQKAAVGAPLVVFETEAEIPATHSGAGHQAARGEQVAAAAADAGAPLATPAVRQRARELGIDLRKVRGSGEGGRITLADLQPVQPAAPASAPDRSVDSWGPVERTKMGRVRRAVAERMLASARDIPHVTVFDRIDVTDLMRAIAERRAGSGDRLAAPTITSFLVRAAALALGRHPVFNASIDMEAGEIVYKRYVNIGIATATDRGLVVPVIRAADTKPVAAIARELSSLAQRVRDGAAIAADASGGGTFTVTNVGGVRGTGNIPLINPPEVAILGVARARQEPAVHDGCIVPRLLLPISLTFDHRIADGEHGARFTAEIATILESPEGLLAELMSDG